MGEEGEEQSNISRQAVVLCNWIQDHWKDKMSSRQCALKHEVTSEQNSEASPGWKGQTAGAKRATAH